MIVDSGEGEQGEALLPCPFCGSEATGIDWQVDGSALACCNYCDAAAQACLTEKQAIERWNRRVPSSTVAGAQGKDLGITESDVNASDATRQNES